MDFNIILKILPPILAQLPTTVFMSIFSMVIATIIGIFLTIFYKTSIVKWFVQLYLLIFRGFPTIVILFVIYFGIPQLLGINTGSNAISFAIICLGLKQAAYLTEIFRSSIDAVDKGQVEAGLAIGLSQYQTYRDIIVPQAIRIMLPSVGNSFIGLLKETSLAFSIGVTEMFGEGRLIAAENFRYFEVYFVIGMLYVAIIYLYTLLQNFLEKSMNYY